MKLLIILAVIVAVASGANLQCLSVDEIADAVIKEADKNVDGVLQLDELSTELINSWSLTNGSCLTFHEFTSNWMRLFHDHHDTAHAFFVNLDHDGNKQLCLEDVTVQFAAYDTNPKDGMIQPAEFKAFMHAVHPDSHQNGGHGHGC